MDLEDFMVLQELPQALTEPEQGLSRYRAAMTGGGYGWLEG